jgi:hypothetical protein
VRVVPWNFRLWRRKKIGPGLRLNLSKSGPSLSIGPQGAKVTIGRRGVRETVGVPGTGLFASKQTKWAGPPTAPTPGVREPIAPIPIPDAWLPIPIAPANAVADPSGAVPRTQPEAASLLATKPPAWEYLYFAALISWGRDELEPRYALLRSGSAPPSGEQVTDEKAPAFLREAMAHLQASVAALDEQFAPARTERAFGPPGQSGDVASIGQLAAHWTEVYRHFVEWSGRLTGATVSAKFRPVFDVAAWIALQPATEYREYVDRFVQTMDAVPGRLAGGQPVRIDLTLNLTLDDAAVAEFGRALASAATGSAAV